MSEIRPVKAGWYNAFRPWTLHGAVVPVLLGGAYAYIDGCFLWWVFLIALIGGCLLQAAANLLNTYGDFEKGTDTVENETRSPELVTGVLRPKDVLKMGMACIGIACLIGLALIWHIGWGILVIGVIGALGAGMYTIGVSYKYSGLGQVGVFFLMGILMPIGTYYSMAGAYSWTLLLVSLPNALMITGVLCGNEMRDYYEDKKADVGTLCGRMTYEHGMMLYKAENILAFVILAVLIVTGTVTVWGCLAFLTLYDLHILLKNTRDAKDDKKASFMLVPLCFRTNWHFGVLLFIGILVGTLF